MFFPSFYNFFSVSILSLFILVHWLSSCCNLLFFLLYSFLVIMKPFSPSSSFHCPRYKLLNFHLYPYYTFCYSSLSSDTSFCHVFFHAAFFLLIPSLIPLFPISLFLLVLFIPHILCTAFRIPQALNISFMSPFFLLPRLLVLIPVCAFPYWSPSFLISSFPISHCHFHF